MGTSLTLRNSTANDKVIKYIPSFTANGSYSVSVSYPCDSLSSTQVNYSVCHTGGTSDFLVNQKIGGGTWI
jgi:hypothetical protein